MRIILRPLTCSTLIALLALATPGGKGAAFVNAGGDAPEPPPLSRTRQQPQTGTRPFDAFPDIQISDWLARADNFAIELQNRPAAKGYIVAYGVPNKFPGWPFRRASQVRGYMVRDRGVDAARVEVVYGGYRDEVSYQLWVAERGAQLPVPPFDFAAALARERTPFLFDRFDWYPLSDGGDNADFSYGGFLDERERYGAFVLALRSDPALRGCVIAYAARRDRRGTDRRLAARIKREVVTTSALGAGRVVAFGGGHRYPSRTAELWLVPPGSPLPKPSRHAAPPKKRASR